eukprot:2662549-Pleurochrysis_carterae.AAC.1
MHWLINLPTYFTAHPPIRVLFPSPSDHTCLLVCSNRTPTPYPLRSSRQPCRSNGAPATHRRFTRLSLENAGALRVHLWEFLIQFLFFGASPFFAASNISNILLRRQDTPVHLRLSCVASLLTGTMSLAPPTQPARGGEPPRPGSN